MARARCTNGVKVLWCRFHLVWMVFEAHALVFVQKTFVTCSCSQRTKSCHKFEFFQVKPHALVSNLNKEVRLMLGYTFALPKQSPIYNPSAKRAIL